MRIALAADHAGAELKAELLARLAPLGHELIDLGGDGSNPEDDYPDYSRALALAILDGRADRGILVCGSGVGASIAASKMPGIRAGLCHDTYSAGQGVEHDDMNVLALGPGSSASRRPSPAPELPGGTASAASPATSAASARSAPSKKRPPAWRRPITARQTPAGDRRRVAGFSQTPTSLTRPPR
jgi:RpiB/LacA/LacB family sugar-phosphate isomerase